MKLQAEIQKCVANITGKSTVSPSADLFEEGITSISAMKLLSALADELHMNLTMEDLRTHASVESLEKLLTERRKEKKDNSVEQDADRKEYPLTSSQLGIFTECLANPEKTQYNLPYLVRFSESVDMERLKGACERIIEAHPYLDITIRQNEQGELVAEKGQMQEKTVKIIHARPDMEHLVRPFSLFGSRLYRFELYEWEEEQYLFFDFHHIIFDGASMHLFLEELETAYKGKPLKPECYTGFDIAIWEEQQRDREGVARAKQYYDSILKGCETNNLPAFYRKKEQTGVGVVRRNISITEACMEFCQKKEMTPQTFFMTAFGYLLSRYKCSDEAVFTTVYHGRSESRMERTIDMLVKTIPMRLSFGKEDIIMNSCRQTGKQYWETIQHAGYPFTAISREYGIRPDVMFCYQGESLPLHKVAGIESRQIRLQPDFSIAPVILEVYYEKDRFLLELTYEREKYSDVWADWFMEHYEKVIQEFLVRKKLKEVELLTERGKTQLERVNSTKAPIDCLSAKEQLEKVAAASPDRIAVICGKEKRTYQQLNENACRIAWGLIKEGIQSGQRVAFLLPRRVEVYEVRQGIIKAGAAFLAIAPDYGNERIQYILEDSKAACIITTKELAAERKEVWDMSGIRVLTLDSLYRTECRQNPVVDIKQEQPVYCIYTSGSTGKPKGVEISHRNLMNYVNPSKTNVGVHAFEHTSVALAVAAFTFDASVLEECVHLYNGRTVCIATEEEIHNPSALAERILAEKVDAMFATPALLGTLAEMPLLQKALIQIRTFFVGGEAFPAALLEQLHRINQDAVVVNAYGPTETTIACTGAVLKDDEDITIGRPLTNTEVYVVDENGHSMPPFIPGELLIAGECVGNGYIGMPEVTKEKFITYRGQKAYYSGDLVYWRGDWNLAYLRRKDQQVKLRGLRVELGEIESVMMQFAAIKECLVMVWGEGMSQYLCGYFTASEPVSRAALTQHLRKYVPDYMVPARLVQLEEFPLTANGKIDRKALEEPERKQPVEYAGQPKNSLQEMLCRIFAMALKREQVSVSDDFFELGGTSLLASKAVMKGMSEGLPLVYADMFRYKTVLGLEAVIQERQFQSESPEVKAFGKRRPDREEAFRQILSQNCITEKMDTRKEAIGNILVTGATGFLGIHVLKEYLDSNEKGIAYCLIRSTGEPAKRRLEHLAEYYFTSQFMKRYGERIVVLEGDITREEEVRNLAQYEFDTVINCAACVKHFVKDKELEQVNTDGVRYLVELCRRKKRKLIQISTVSVAGETKEDAPERFSEQQSDRGQILENAYAKSKYDAERQVLKGMEAGLSAKIIRVGNLMGRFLDGKFQINRESNGFIRRLQGYISLKMVPVSLLDEVVEFSPVDLVAKGVLECSAMSGNYSVFHVYHPQRILLADVVDVLNDLGHCVKPVADQVFEKALQEGIVDESQNSGLEGLISYNTAGKAVDRKEILPENRFTTKLLIMTGFRWGIIDRTYLEKLVSDVWH